MNLQRRIELWGAVAVFLLTQVVYVLTLTVECPFWDSGEFIATSYILGIPHPPGTPLYVLIGRVFAMVPAFEMVATRVNYLSAFASSLAAAFTFLVTLEFFGRWSRRADGTSAVPAGDDPKGRPERGHLVIGALAGFVAAGFAAFGRTFWDNAIEAEVYALSSLIMVLCFWLILKWARPGDRSRNMGLFVLLYYLICLSMGIHLGTFLVLPGILLFALLSDRRLFGESVVGAMLVAGVVMLLHPGMLPTLGIGIYGGLFAVVAIASLVSIAREALGGKPLHPLVGGRGLLTWCLVVALLGISTHLYLLIRAQSDVAINEADPSGIANLWKVLIRDQYKPPNPFTFRKAPWDVQFEKHFLAYAYDQYDLGWKGVGRNLALGLPYVLGLVGFLGQILRRRKDGLLMLVTYLIMSVGLVFYLNFREDEVRERDYFFVASFHFFAIWIGLGVGYLLEELRGVLARTGAGLRAAVVAVAGLAFLLLPVTRVAAGWFSHDRTHFYVASDFAHNVLASLERDAVLFTNGDNDTFPLWYIQEVEGFRKDVRVVNLSLLNTDWYLRQLRDLEPRVDHGWDDEMCLVVAEFSGYSGAFQAGRIQRDLFTRYLQQSGLRPYVRTLDEPLMAKDVAVARIVEREYGKRPLYIALTVPDHMGMENRLVQDGIVFRIADPAGKEIRLDIERSRELLVDVYRYRGILDADGKHDDSVYKDPNSTRLVQNYAASHLTLAQELARRGSSDEALALALRAREISPQASAVYYSLGILYRQMGRFEEMERVFTEILELGRGDPQIVSLVALAQELQGEFEAAAATYRAAIPQYPEDFELRRALFAVLWRDLRRYHEAVDVLDAWLAESPGDASMRAAVQAYRDSADILTGGTRNSP